MVMTRLRWGLAAATAVLTLVSAIQSLRAYAAHDMTLGLWAVVGLAVLLVVGFASLGWARLRIARELGALAGAGPAGQLESARRKRLQAIKDADAIADREALAEATRADEAGHAYIGRYLVATTVLIGLVGTFAGLMETLGKVAPLLSDKDAGGIALLAAPLGGLHVTFGATLVAILATLALALAHGDLALAEERALALLEDRTTHEWIPRLWPRAEDAAERTARAVDGLRTTLGDAVARAIEASVKRLADGARADSERASRALEQTTSAVEKQIGALSTLIARATEDSARKQGELLATAAARQTAALEAAAGRVEARVDGATTKIEGATGRIEARVDDATTKIEGATGRVAARVDDAATKIVKALRVEIEGALAALVTAGRTTLLGVQEAAESTVARHAAATEAALTRVAELTGTSLGRAAAAAADASERAVKAAEESARHSTALSEETARQTGALWEESVRRSTEWSEQLLLGTTAMADKATRATTEAVVRTLGPLFAEEGARMETVRGALADTAAQLELSASRIGELSASLDGAAREQVAALDRHGESLLTAFDRVVVGGGTALTESAGTLAAATRQLQGSAELLAPRLQTLSTELGALSREVALLLAARGPDGDVGAIVLGELERLGAGFDRLTALLRLADGPADVREMGPGELTPAAPAEDPVKVETSIVADAAGVADVADVADVAAVAEDDPKAELS